LTSTAAPHKDEFSPDEALRPDDRRRAQKLADEFHAAFVNDLARGRRLPIHKINADFGGGRVLSAKEALAAGMIDAVESFDEAVSAAPKVKPLRNWRVDLQHRRLSLKVRAAMDTHEEARAQSLLREFEAQHF
jgi:ClpP class serine protease